MINIKEILYSFSDEHQQGFISYLEKKNTRKDAKNIFLTRLLIEDRFSSKELSKKIYGKQNKVALHALRKRLFQSLIDFSSNISMKEESSIDIKLIKHILCARSFLQKGHSQIGYHILSKVEIIANEYQLFTILHEVYHSKIEYAYTNPKCNLDKTINKFKENQKQLIAEENLNIAYAKIRKSLVEYQQNKSKINIKYLIENTLKENNSSISDAISFKSLYQIIQIISFSSIQNFDFWNIEQFVVDSYQVIKNHPSKDKQLYYHLEIVYVISNVLFRNKKFEESLEYLSLMSSLMKERNQKYNKQFAPRYDLLLSLNYNYTNQQEKAILLLENYKNKSNIDVVHQLDILLSLVVFYFQNSSLENASKQISKFYHTDKWYIKKSGIIWTIKKNLIDILLQIDLRNIDLVESRLKSFKRTYTSHLREINQERVIVYLKLVEAYYKSPDIASTKTFKDKVETSLTMIDIEKEDIFMMSFYAWLKAKMTKQDVYLVTLNLING